MAEGVGAKPRRRRGLIAAVVAAAFIALALLALAAVSVEPLRVHIWQFAGQQCGSVYSTNFDSPVGHVGHDFTTDEVCLQTAALKCRAATLTYVRTGLDTQLTVTFVVEPAVPRLAPCAIAARWTNSVDAGIIRRSGLDHCAGVDYENDGLHALSCGSLGTFVMPNA